MRDITDGLIDMLQSVYVNWMALIDVKFVEKELTYLQ